MAKKKKECPLKEGDVINLKKGTHEFCADWLVLELIIGGVRLGHLKTGRQIHFGQDMIKQYLAKIVRHIDTENMESLVQDVGLGFATIIRQFRLPGGCCSYLEGLTTEQLTEVSKRILWSHDFHDIDLQREVRRIMEERGELDKDKKERKKPLTADHVVNICQIYGVEKCCSFLVAGASVVCAKTSDPGLCQMICFRRNDGNMIAKGDYCVGRSGEVPIEDIPHKPTKEKEETT